MILALQNLADKQLIKLEKMRIIILEPPTLDYWRDQDRKQSQPEPKPELLADPRELTENWLITMVEYHYKAATVSLRKSLAVSIEGYIQLMKAAQVSIKDIQEYWQEMLMVLTGHSTEIYDALDFTIQFQYILQEAAQCHQQKGQKNCSCIHNLKHVTQQTLNACRCGVSDAVAC